MVGRKNGVFLTAAVFLLLSDGAELLTAFVRQHRLGLVYCGDGVD